MDVKFRFPKPLIWGSIALLLFVITGCSLPMDPVSDPPPPEKTEEQSSEEDPDDENGEQNSDDGQGDSEDEDAEDEERTPGEEQNDSEDEGAEDERVPGEEPGGSEDGGGNVEGQVPGGEQNSSESGNGGKTEPSPGGEQGTPGNESGGEQEAPASGNDGKTEPSPGGEQEASGNESGGEQEAPAGGNGGKTEPSPGGEQEASGNESGGEAKPNPGGEQEAPVGGNGGKTEPSPGGEQGASGNESGGEMEPNPGNEDETGEAPIPGGISIRIGEMRKQGEGVYPDLGGITRYRLDFLGENGKTAESLYLEADGELTVRLDAGEWEIHAYGVLTKGTGQIPVIHGTARVTVYESGTETVLLVPDGPIAESKEQGFLSWNIDYPDEKVWEAILKVSIRVDEHSFIPYRYFDLTAPGAKEQKIPLLPGTYKMESRFLSHTISTGSTEIVHIYPGLETRSSRVTIAGNLFPNAVEFLSVEELKTYLDGRPENTEAAPYPVKIAGVDLSGKGKTGETMKTLYDALSRYVSLDLRGGSGTELIAASASPALAGRKKIVSMVLPETITTVKSNGFSGYEALKSAVLPKVTTIDYAAFNNLGSLETVAAPELIDIVDSKNTTSSSNGIFYKCSALKSAYFPKLETTGHHTFYECGSLTEAVFPSLRTVGEFAFKGCTALKSVSFPAVTKIDKSSFENDTALTCLILGSVPPELGTNVFKGGDFSQNGVIYVPSDAVDTYKNTALPNWSMLTELVRPLSDLVDH